YVKDLDTLEVTRIGLTLDGVTYATSVRGVSISDDGNLVLFESSDANLVPDDTNGQTDLFLLSRSTGDVVRVNVAQDGTEGDGGSRALGRALSTDGRYVTFWSDATTFPRSTESDGAAAYEVSEDVYVKDLVTGALTLVSTNAKDVSGDSDSVLPTISGDGRF